MKKSMVMGPVAFCVSLACFPGESRGQPSPERCASGGGPTICVRFDNVGPAPQEDFDYRFDVVTDPAKPSVQLLRGRDPQQTLYSWRVWSWDAQENPANIGSITSPGEYDYSVTILQPDDQQAGADNVALIDLQPGDPSNWSDLPAGEISGNLNGDLTLQESGGQGGVASFQILGAAQGDITVREVSYLGIKGDVSGNIDVDEVTGSLQISGDVFGTIGVDTITDSGLLKVTGALTNTSLNVAGSVESTGRIEIWKAVGTTLTVNGDLLGDIKVTGELDGATLEVKGAVGPEAFVEIAETAGVVSIEFGEDGHPEMFAFAGDLSLLSGTENGATVKFHGPLTVTGEGDDEHTPTIDLNAHDVVGGLYFHKGGTGDIVNGGEIVGLVQVAGGAAEDPSDFGGEVTFASVGSNGKILACPGNIAGHINILGNLNGNITATGGDDISGNLTDGAEILIGGDLCGRVDFQYDIAGTVFVEGNMHANAQIMAFRHIAGPVTITGGVNGKIVSNGNGSGDGDITGPVSVGGVFNGNICGHNFYPMLCDLPVNIDIPNFGLFGTVCGCRCTLSPPELPPGLDPGREERFPKNRYLSIAPPQEPGWQTAIRVKLTDTNLADPEFQAAIGREWWHGQPQRYCEIGGQAAAPDPDNPPHYGCTVAPGVPSSTFLAAPLQCTPHYMDWNGVCDEGTCVGGLKDGESCAGDAACWGMVHVFGSYINGSSGNDPDPEGSWILPASTYEIQAVHELCGYGYEDAFSESLTLTTSIHGDIVGDFNPFDNYWMPPDGMVDITRDVTAVLDKFKSIPYSPIKSRCDIDPEAVEQLINITDVTYVYDAFLGGTYAFDAPDQCAGQ